uniref:uncharacterized protein LOC120328094 n=1 Tax=Styela clava TaxID=7725 RepID=UPI00193975D8|nr:uncharacterized protein LOC120328094 [Styela clava]
MAKRSRRNVFGNRTAANDEIKTGSYPLVTGDYEWVPGPESDEQFPDNMVCGGKLETGQFAYIGRADVEDQTPSGFVLKETRELHVPYGTSEHRLRNYDVLVVKDQNILAWQECENGRPPSTTCCIPLEVGGNFRESMQIGRTCTPLIEGHTWNEMQLEVSRWVNTDNNVHRLGKIHRNHQCLYIPYQGREYIFRRHEMLMLKTSPGSLKRICRWSILKYLEHTRSKSSKTIDSLPLPNKIKGYLKHTDK